MEKIQPGKFVELGYDLYEITPDGTQNLVHQTDDADPEKLVFGVTPGVIVPLEKAIEGLVAGDKFDITVKAADAFGPVDPDQVAELEKEIFEVDGKFDSEMVKPGAVVPMMTSTGYRVMGKVEAVTDTHVKMDFNHPLAGKNVRFNGRIMPCARLLPKNFHPPRDVAAAAAAVMTAAIAATAASVAAATPSVAVVDIDKTLPAEFVRRVLGQADMIPDPQGLLDALASGNPCVAIRHNRAKGAAPGPEADTVPWCPSGEYLAERPQFTFDPAFHQGRYYVQDPSSMCISAVIESLGLDSPVAYLDACAAPGGKTTAAIGALPDGSFVVANEYDPSRAAVLVENLTKWGAADVAVTVGDTARLARYGCDSFDVVAADVPCSGEGMMRKDPRAVAQWTPELVRQCASLQRSILANLWPMLRPGGYFIYSTCTFSREENEDNVDWLCEEYGAERLPLPFGGESGVVCGHFYPHLVRGEGLFIALLRKPGEFHPDAAVSEKKLRKATSVALYGVQETEEKGRDRIPTHRYALSTSYPRGTYPEAEVDRDTALRYLHRDALVLPDGVPRGIVLLTYQDHPLGFVKNLGSRANNMLPKSFRILSML